MERDRVLTHTRIEQLTDPVDRSTENTLTGLIRIMGTTRSEGNYPELRDAIESYANPDNAEKVLLIARGAVMYTMYSEPEIVGFATARIQDSEQGTGLHIDEFFVHPTARGSGRGSALEEALVELAEERNARYAQIDHEDIDDPSRVWLAERGYDVSHEQPRKELI